MLRISHIKLVPVDISNRLAASAYRMLLSLLCRNVRMKIVTHSVKASHLLVIDSAVQAFLLLGVVDGRLQNRGLVLDLSIPCHNKR